MKTPFALSSALIAALLSMLAMATPALAADLAATSDSAVAAPKAETAKSEPAKTAAPATMAEPAKTDSAAPAPEEPVEPQLDRVLKQAEKAGDDIDQLTADFDYDYNQKLIDEHEWRVGRMTYKKPNKFQLEFTDGAKETFRFNGRLYVEDRPAQKQRYVYRLKKDGEPAVADLDIDKVPFPMPFGQKRDKVLKNFDAKSLGKQKLEPWGRPLAKGVEAPPPDTKEYEHLDLVPKAKTALARDYKKIEFWMDENGMPKQIRTVDKSERELTVRFKNIKKNGSPKIDDKFFEPGQLPSKDWEQTENDLTEEKAAPALRP